MLLREALEVMPCIPDTTSMYLLYNSVRKSSNGNLDKEPTLKNTKAHSYVPEVLGGWKEGRKRCSGA